MELRQSYILLLLVSALISYKYNVTIALDMDVVHTSSKLNVTVFSCHLGQFGDVTVALLRSLTLNYSAKKQ